MGGKIVVDCCITFAVVGRVVPAKCVKDSCSVVVNAAVVVGSTVVVGGCAVVVGGAFIVGGAVIGHVVVVPAEVVLRGYLNLGFAVVVEDCSDVVVVGDVVEVLLR